jgi:hypothetical protein
VRRALEASTASQSTRRRFDSAGFMSSAPGTTMVSIAAPSNSASGKVSIVRPSEVTIGPPSRLTVAVPTQLFHERGRRPEDRERTGEVKHPSP